MTSADFKAAWLSHQVECPSCRQVDLGRTRTLSEACTIGAQRLKDYLAAEATEKIQKQLT